VVNTDEDGYKSMDYGILVSLGIGTLKEHQKIIESIYSRINKIKEFVDAV